MSTRKIDDGAIALTHGVLFEPGIARCDACSALLDAAEDDDGESGRYGVRGRGLYVWTRGSEVRYEKPPLCASCAAAVGMSALARWEIEEEEG
jgi:hypothetical protein